MMAASELGIAQRFFVVIICAVRLPLEDVRHLVCWLLQAVYGGPRG